MDRFIASQNVERFRRQLEGERDPSMRETLSRLLTEAEEQLRRIEADHSGTPHS